MAPGIRGLISFFLLQITASSCTSKVHGDGQGHHADAVGGNDLTQPNACRHLEVPINSFKIVHRFGPCSPWNNSTPSDNDEILRQDMLRVPYLQRRIRSGSVSSRDTSVDPLAQGLVHTTIPVTSGARIGSYLYVIIVSLGMPRRIQTVAFDTGSSFSWIQCHPCRPCKRQRDPLFDPTLSHSYRTVPCDDPACTQLPHDAWGCTKNNTCTYNITYVDLDSSRGIVSMERLLLPTFAAEFPNFVFGCSHQNLVTGEGTGALFGLGRGFHSLVTQTSNRFGRSFSYCIPSSNTGEGYLTLGHREDASRTTYTPMLHNPRIDPDIYFINLTAISVNNRRLQMPSQIMERGGTVVDSGASITHLPLDLYGQVRDAFSQGMSRYNYQPAPAYKNLDTCYNISGPSFPYPEVTFHFDRNTDLVLSSAQVFFHKDRNTYCLAFVAVQDDIATIGTSQQRGIEVIYDIEQERFGFSPGTNCR